MKQNYISLFIHYEALLIKRVNEIAIRKKKKQNIGLLSIVITILSFSGGSYGLYIIDHSVNYIRLSPQYLGPSLVLLILSTINLVHTVYAFLKVQKIKKVSKIENVKFRSYQQNLLGRYLLGKINEKHNEEFKSVQEFCDFYKENSEVIAFTRSEFKRYLHDNYSSVLEKDLELLDYLEEVVLLRGLINNKIKHSGFAEEYENNYCVKVNQNKILELFFSDHSMEMIKSQFGVG